MTTYHKIENTEYCSEPVYAFIASRLLQIENLRKRNAVDAARGREMELDEILKAYAPSGSGIDAGTCIDWDKSKYNKLVLTFSFHHLNDNGYYCGWTEHNAVVTPQLWTAFDLRITGPDKQGIKEYLHHVYDSWLTDRVVWPFGELSGGTFTVLSSYRFDDQLREYHNKLQGGNK